MKYYLIAFGLVGMIALTSCTAYRYFPHRMEFYGFDTAKDYRITIEPSVPVILGSFGFAMSGAYSFNDRHAFSLHAFSRLTPGYNSHYKSGNNADLWNRQHWRSNATGGGAGFIYFKKLSLTTGCEFYADYDFQMVHYSFGVSHSSPYDGVDIYTSNALHTIRLQPNFYNQGRSSKTNFGIGINAMFSSSELYLDDATRVLGVPYDLLIQPGFAVNKKTFQYGANLNVSLVHPFATGYKSGGHEYLAFYQEPINVYARVMFSKRRGPKPEKGAKKHSEVPWFLK